MSIEIEEFSSYTTDPYLNPMHAYNRLEEEYVKYGSLSIGFDFDATVHDYHKVGATHERVIKLLQGLAEIGCKLYCWTCYPDLTYVINFCKERNIPLTGVNSDGLQLPWSSRKPFYSALLDDRAGLDSVYGNLILLVHQVKEGYVQRTTTGDNQVSLSEQRTDIQHSQGLGGSTGVGIGIEPVSTETDESSTSGDH